jgi:SAM-dependent methyltransferase
MGLGARCEFRVGNFTDLSAFDEGTFDGVYSFQTICYSADKRKTYEGFKRVLKPGGRFAEYAWATKPAYDPKNAAHVEIVENIAHNVKCQKLEPVDDIVRHLRDSGLRLCMSVDLTELDGLDWTRPVRLFNHPLLLRLIRASVRLLPAKVWPVHDFLVRGLPYYVDAHRLDIFTPCHLIVAQKDG